MGEAKPLPPPTDAERASPGDTLPDPPDGYDYLDDMTDDCPNCGGEGYVSSCFEEFACLDPEDGCDLCTHRCDWCNPRPALKTQGGDHGR